MDSARGIRTLRPSVHKMRDTGSNQTMRHKSHLLRTMGRPELGRRVGQVAPVADRGVKEEEEEEEDEEKGQAAGREDGHTKT